MISPWMLRVSRQKNFSRDFPPCSIAWARFREVGEPKIFNFCKISPKFSKNSLSALEAIATPHRGKFSTSPIFANFTPFPGPKPPIGVSRAALFDELGLEASFTTQKGKNLGYSEFQSNERTVLVANFAEAVLWLQIELEARRRSYKLVWVMRCRR